MRTDQQTARERLAQALAALDAILESPPHLLTTDELKQVVGKRANDVKHAACALCDSFLISNPRGT